MVGVMTTECPAGRVSKPGQWSVQMSSTFGRLVATAPSCCKAGAKRSTCCRRPAGESPQTDDYMSPFRSGGESVYSVNRQSETT